MPRGYKKRILKSDTDLDKLPDTHLMPRGYNQRKLKPETDLDKLPDTTYGRNQGLPIIAEPDTTYGRNQGLPSSYLSSSVNSPEPPNWTSERQKVEMEGGLTKFFDSLMSKSIKLISWSVKTLTPALLGAALFPVLGPVGGGAVVAGTTAVLHLREDTVNKLLEPLQGKEFSARELREAIEKVLSEDRQANEDLKQFFINLQPIIEKAATSSNITISGDVHGLIVGDRNTITQTFSGYLQDKS
jgi:hypothetical protein